jgi:hypothetical protein
MMTFSAHECLRICGLEAYADALIGSLHTEHIRRTTIGVELAAKVLIGYIENTRSRSMSSSRNYYSSWTSQHRD